MTSAPVTLAATLHDAENELLALIRQHLPALRQLYAALVLNCSATTHADIVALLRDGGATVHREPAGPPGHDRMGQVRRDTVRLALDADPDHIHLCDFDRALHWIAHYPDELRQVVGETIPAHDFVILGRTERALATHPRSQTESERWINEVFAPVYGQWVDVTGGSRGLSRRAAALLLQHSRDVTVGVDAEWPLILRRFPGLRLGYRACEGLEFETADRGLPADYFDSPAVWARRLKVAWQVVEAIARMEAQETLIRP